MGCFFYAPFSLVHSLHGFGSRGCDFVLATVWSSVGLSFDDCGSFTCFFNLVGVGEVSLALGDDVFEVVLIVLFA